MQAHDATLGRHGFQTVVDREYVGNIVAAAYPIIREEVEANAIDEAVIELREMGLPDDMLEKFVIGMNGGYDE